MASALEPLDRAEHADRGRDHAVAVEERGAGDHEERDPADRSALAAHAALGHEREEREDAALAVVVRAHDEARGTSRSRRA